MNNVRSRERRKEVSSWLSGYFSKAQEMVLDALNKPQDMMVCVDELKQPDKQESARPAQRHRHLILPPQDTCVHLFDTSDVCVESEHFRPLPRGLMHPLAQFW